MPVLINADSGEAEDLKAPDAALAQGTHEIPIVSPDGDIGSAPLADARELMEQGYTQPTPQQLSHLLNQTKYGSTSQQILGGAEQVAKGVAGPLATAAERALGVKPEDIRGREEQQSTPSKMLLQGAGLLGSAFIPGGQAKVLGRAGEMGAHLLGLGEATSTIAKVGTVAAKAAIENATFQALDESSKFIMKDPDQTAGSAAVNVGLAGLIGAGTGGLAAGVVSPLWGATVGPRAENLLRMIANRANGETLPLSQDLAMIIKSMEEQGIKVPPELRAGLSDNPTANAHFLHLRESGTTTGDALKETIQTFKDDVGEQLTSVFKSKEPMTSFEAGEKAKDLILKQAETLHDAISEKYKDVIPHMEAIEIPKIERNKFAESLLKAGAEFGAAGSPAEGLFKNYAERIQAQGNVGQVKKLATEVGSDWSVARRAGDFEKAKALADIRGALKEFQDNQVINAGKALEKSGVPGAAEMSEGLVRDKKIADKAYSEFVDKLGDIASVGKLGKVKSHGQLLEALDKIPAAKLADKLFDPKNVEGLRFLQKEFPEVFENILQAKKTSMFEAATSKGDLMHNQLLNTVNKLPKEVRAMMFKAEEEALINASGKILRETGKRLNPSGTAGTLDKLMQHMPAGVGGVASLLLGHNPIVGVLLGEASKFLGRDAPDAAKMSLLKFLGSTEPIDGTAWKAAGDYIASALKGEALIVKASKAAIKAGQEVLPKAKLPDQKSREKLDKRLKELQVDNSSMLDVGGKIGHYMPEHATSIAGMSMNAVNYLNEIRPKPIKNAPLDAEIEPSTAAKSNYNRAMDIAQQPLVVLQSIQDGTLTPMDLQHLTALYPKIHDRLMLSLTDAMVNQTSKGEPIKYQQRMSLSLFMAQPLDSTMTPLAIMAAQPPPPTNPSSQPNHMKHPSQTTAKAMTNLAKGNASGSQMREMQKAGMAKA